jgi:hypothetical protein
VIIAVIIAQTPPMVGPRITPKDPPLVRLFDDDWVGEVFWLVVLGMSFELSMGAIGEVIWLVVLGMRSKIDVETVKIVVGDVALGVVAVGVIRSEFLYLTSTIDAHMSPSRGG